MNPMKSAYHDLKPQRKDWVLTGISLLSVLIGVIILPENWNVGIVTIAFFGVCSGTFLATILRKMRESQFQSLSIDVAGGLDIQPSRVRVWMMACLLIFLGSILIVFGKEYPFVFRLISYFIAGSGFFLAVLVALGKIPSGFLRFDSDGFRIGRKKWTVFLPWDEIAEVSAGEFNSNSAVFLTLRSFDRIKTEPEEFYSKAIQEILSSEAWVGAHFMILTSNYGMSSPMLVEAITQYTTQPEAREKLSRVRIEKGS
ncbi:hypothetical protein [Leptospira stimsonii]|uniref:Uncharacterized protein n=1 Tax=Leptospira stimsonii TaxID=2202203 RepID=A0A8B3CQR0_9LEPT|nr:hypothetical protein [Leptospira stimsonii]RHX86298.1 hypothetical protein DLM78_10675 [Leptospira stimsonii]